jgi:hypothetical protein
MRLLRVFIVDPHPLHGNGMVFHEYLRNATAQVTGNNIVFGFTGSAANAGAAENKIYTQKMQFFSSVSSFCFNLKNISKTVMLKRVIENSDLKYVLRWRKNWKWEQVLTE